MSQYILVSIEHDSRSELKHGFVLCPVRTIYCEGNALQRIFDDLYLEYRRMVLEYQSLNTGPFIPESVLRLYELHLNAMGNAKLHSLYEQCKMGYLDEDPLTSFPESYKTYCEGHGLHTTHDNINIYRASGVYAGGDDQTVH